MPKPVTESAPNCPPLPQLEFFTLGKVELHRPPDGIVLQKSKPLALLAFVLATPTKSVSREEIAALLWGDSSPERARNALRITLHRLRQAMGVRTGELPGGEISFQVPIVWDSELFLGALQAGDLDRAIATYGGPFFPQYSDAGTAEFEHWADIERERLQGLYLRAAQSLVERRILEGRAREARAIARRVRSLIPGSEAGWVLLIQALLASGDTFEAQAEGEAFATWLSHEHRDPGIASVRTLGMLRGETAGQGSSEPTALTPELVGRAGELAAILTAWDKTVRGSPRHVHLDGPAGFGKTRLLDEAMRRIKGLGGRIIRVRAISAERDLDCAVIAALARELGAAPGASGVPPACIPLLLRLQPSLSSRFSQGPAELPASTSTLQNVQVLDELLNAVADDRPTLVAIDDLHWADRESDRVLRSISEHLHGKRALLLTAARPGYRDLGGQVEVLQLQALSQEDTEYLLASVAAFPTPLLASRFAATVHRCSGGSPLLVLDLLRLVLSRGALAVSGGMWTSIDFDSALQAMENSGLLQNRIEALDPSVRSTLDRLALGRMPLSLDDVIAITGMPSALVLGDLETLERRGYVTSTTGRWEVANEEIESATIDRLSHDERVHIHRDLGRWLAKSVNDPVAAHNAAWHLCASGFLPELQQLIRQVVTSARRAGQRVPSSHLVRKLLGPQYENLVADLTRSLPLTLRYRARRAVLVLAGIAAFLSAILLPTVFVDRTQTPEATFFVYQGDPRRDRITILEVPVSRSRWMIPGPIPDNVGQDVGEWRGTLGLSGSRVGPDRRIAYVRAMPDSGLTDIFLRENDGTVRRLTTTPGDDVDPTWAPDGRYLAFRTLRWSSKNDRNFDLGLLDLLTGQTRQLTSGSDGDWDPRWSPDGSRIAFRRRIEADGSSLVCWVSFDGRQERCLERGREQPQLLVGWKDPEHLIAISRADSGQSRLVSIDLAQEQVVLLDPQFGDCFATLSPDGSWIAKECVEGTDSVEIYRLDDTTHRRRARMGPESPRGAARGFGWTGMGITDSNRLALKIRLPNTAYVGVPQLLRAESRSGPSSGLHYPREVLSWRVADTAVATILSHEGTVIPQRPGTTWLYASAGGWRSDSVAFTVELPKPHTLFAEDWSDSTLANWSSFGEPLPRVLADRQSGSFLMNGDETFESGVVSRVQLHSTAGVGVEALVNVPLTQAKWQRIRIGLGEIQNIVPQGGVGLNGCSFSFPAEEGRAGLRSVLLEPSPGLDVRLPAPQGLADRRWHKVRIQLFPDQTCGFAVDDSAFFRSRIPLVMLGPVRIALYGQSVGTEILIGRLEAWEGVRTDRNWAVLRW